MEMRMVSQKAVNLTVDARLLAAASEARPNWWARRDPDILDAAASLAAIRSRSRSLSSNYGSPFVVRLCLTCANQRSTGGSRMIGSVPSAREVGGGGPGTGGVLRRGSG